MRYLTHYEEYPIYEPAEGGYYYSGNQATETERLSKRKAKAEMKRLWEEAQEENKELSERDRWILSRDGNMLRRSSKYIGSGESYVIERNYGSQRRGYKPYC